MQLTGFITDKQRIYLPNLANIIQAYQNPNTSPQWKDTYQEQLTEANKMLPHGSGIDGKCEIDIDNCGIEQVSIIVEFHHMNENGMYTNWTRHRIILTASLIHGFKMKITGKDQNGIKEYLRDLFSDLFTVDSHE